MQARAGRPSAVFFDWDGTLVDTYGLIQAAHEDAHAKLGLNAPTGDGWFRPFFGRPRDEIYKALYGGQGAQAKSFFEAFVTRHHEERIIPMPGAQDLLQALSVLRIPVAVVSNKRQDYVETEIKALRWDGFIAAVSGAGTPVPEKPDPAALMHALHATGLGQGDLGTLWYAGDTEIDRQLANAAGCQFILVDPNSSFDKDNGQYKTLVTVKSCAGLLDFLLHCLEN